MADAKKELVMDGKPHKACWNKVVLAESAKCVTIDGILYFPYQDTRLKFFLPCPKTASDWMGDRKYYDIVVNKDRLPASAWTYLNPKEAARKVKAFVAFVPEGGVQLDGSRELS